MHRIYSILERMLTALLMQYQILLNISRYESHRYAFEIHQYTQVIHP